MVSQEVQGHTQSGMRCQRSHKVKQGGQRSCKVLDGVLEVTRGLAGWMKVVQGQGRSAGGHMRLNREDQGNTRLWTEC